MIKPTGLKSRPRIAIIGNMNNNGFSIMRYFRDLGANAYLLPFSTDGVGNLSHFAPAADTWKSELWDPFIQPLNLPNTTLSVLELFRVLKRYPRNGFIKQLFDRYDFYIGSGIAPALFHSLGLKLDIFFPYGTGIEFYGDIAFSTLSTPFSIKYPVYKRLAALQAAGIRESSHCLNAEMSLTKASFEEIGKPFQRLAIPMVYNRESVTRIPPNLRLSQTLERVHSSDITLFCCSRLLWERDKRYSEESWKRFTKNSDWLFRGIAEFLLQYPNVRPLLVVVEYGPDVECTKQLVSELGLDPYVFWLPILPRREILYLLSHSDIGVGEFYSDPGVIWGGTGWEVLASGKPLLQSFNFTAASLKPNLGNLHHHFLTSSLHMMFQGIFIKCTQILN